TSLATCSTWAVRSRPPESRTTSDISLSMRARYARRRSGTWAFTLDASAIRAASAADESIGAPGGVGVTTCAAHGVATRAASAVATRLRRQMLIEVAPNISLTPPRQLIVAPPLDAPCEQRLGICFK